MNNSSFDLFFDEPQAPYDIEDELSVISYLQKCCQAYYTEGKKPLLEDKEYDQLYDFAKERWPENSFFSEENIGAIPTNNKVEHEFILGSLTKFKDENISDFIDPLDPEGTIYILPKYDGLSIFAEFNEGKLIRAATRGNGTVGQDITEKAQYFCHTPTKNHVKLRGEILLTGNTHESLGFANRRNGASGLVGQKYYDPEKLKLLKVVWYEVIEPSMKLSDSLDLLKTHYRKIKVKHFKDANEIFEVTKSYFKGEIDLDGLVLAYDSIDEPYIRENAYYPSNKVCWKPATQTAEAIIKEIVWTTSRTGRVVPVAHFETPIFLDGSYVSKSTAHNAKFVLDNKLHPGSKVLICKANYVIPKILKVF